MSDAIILVHQFILDLLDHVCADDQVKTELYDNVLLEQLQGAYKKAMNQAHFLLQIEREGKPITFNESFNAELQRGQTSRVKEALTQSPPDVRTDTKGRNYVKLDSVLSGLCIDRSNPEQIREYLHDVLRSYYGISVKRFVDVVCQQVINHYLLNGKESPLHVFSTDLVLDLDARVLELVAGEDEATKQERARLTREIDSLQRAVTVLRGP